MDWFTADTHFGHRRIIEYCNRPFTNVPEMDTALINNINELAKPDDRLFHLGDVVFKGGNLAAYRSRIVCENVFVVPGNHDKEKELVRYFQVLPQCYMYHDPKDHGYRIVLCHYALRVWQGSHHGAGHLYGHSHGGLPPVPGAPAFDVGVDCWNYRPLSLTEVKQEMIRLCTLAPVGKEHMHHAQENDIQHG